MTPVPSDEAVEAAARDAFWRDDLGGHIKGRWTWDTIPDEGRDNYRAMSCAALIAAYAIDAPTIAAEAAAEARAATLREVEAWIVNDAKWMDTRAERERWAREIAAHFNPEANEPQREEQ